MYLEEFLDTIINQGRTLSFIYVIPIFIFISTQHLNCYSYILTQIMWLYCELMSEVYILCSTLFSMSMSLLLL